MPPRFEIKAGKPGDHASDSMAKNMWHSCDQKFMVSTWWPKYEITKLETKMLRLPYDNNIIIPSHFTHTS